jgi:hypothetical protein
LNRTTVGYSADLGEFCEEQPTPSADLQAFCFCEAVEVVIPLHWDARVLPGFAPAGTLSHASFVTTSSLRLRLQLHQ